MDSAKIMEKIKKAPKALWFLVLFASLLLKNLYVVNETIKLMPELMAEFGFDTGLIPEPTPAMTTFFYIFNSLIGLAFFEFMVYLAYNSFVRRRFLYPNITKTDFGLPIRVLYSVGNLCVGLISLLYFLVPQMADFGNSLIVFAFDSAALLLAFLLIKNNSYILKGGLKASFSFFYKTYGGIFLVLSILNILSVYDEKELLIVQIAHLILVLIFFLVSGLIQARLAEKDKEDLDNIPPEQPKEIFKGFGF